MKGPASPAVDPGASGVRVAVAIALVALLVRIPGLNGGLWLDEIATIQDFIRLPLADIVTTYGSPNNHLLYTLLGHISVAIFGEEAWAVRLPAVVLGVATAPALYLLVRESFTEREAIGSGLILAVSYHHVYFSQNARGYSGLLFFSVLSTWILLKALSTGRRSWWLGYSTVAALNVYMLLTGLFVTMAQVLGAVVVYVVLDPDREARKDRFKAIVGGTALAALFTVLLYAPLFGQMLGFYTTVEPDFGWMPFDGLLGIILQTSLPTSDPTLLLLGAVLGIPVALAGVVRVTRRSPLMMFAFLIPPLIELVVTLLLGAGTSPRRFLLVLPLAGVIGVAGVHAMAVWAGDRLRSSTTATGVFAVGLLAGMVAMAAELPRLYELPKQDFEGALAFVEAEKGQDDLVAAAWIAQPPVQFFDPSVLSARTLNDLRNILAEQETVWLLATMLEDLPKREPALARFIGDRFQEVARFRGLVGDGDVVVFRSTED